MKKRTLEELNAVIDSWDKEKELKVMKEFFECARAGIHEYSTKDNHDDLETLMEAFELALVDAEKSGHQ